MSKALTLAFAVVVDLEDAWTRLRAGGPLTQDLAELLGGWFEVERVAAGCTGYALVKAAQRQVEFLTALRTWLADNDAIERTAGTQSAQGVGFAGFQGAEKLLKCRIVKPVHDEAVWRMLGQRSGFDNAKEAA